MRISYILTAVTLVYVLSHADNVLGKMVKVNNLRQHIKDHGCFRKNMFFMYKHNRKISAYYTTKKTIKNSIHVAYKCQDECYNSRKAMKIGGNTHFFPCRSFFYDPKRELCVLQHDPERIPLRRILDVSRSRMLGPHGIISGGPYCEDAWPDYKGDMISITSDFNVTDIENNLAALDTDGKGFSTMVSKAEEKCPSQKNKCKANFNKFRLNMNRAAQGLAIGKGLAEGLVKVLDKGKPDALKTSIGAAENALDVFVKPKKGKIKKLVSKLGKLAPFLGALGAAASLFGLFGKSPEVQRLDHVIKLINNGFQNMEKRFDKIEEKFKDLKEDIKDELTKNHFWTNLLPYTNQLSSTEKKVKRYFSVKRAAQISREKDLGHTEYSNVFKAINAIYDAFTKRNPNKLCDEVRDFTNENRREVLAISVDLFSKMAKGAAHLDLIGKLLGRNDVEQTMEEMDTMLREVWFEIEICDLEIESGWIDQWHNDIRRYFLDKKPQMMFKYGDGICQGRGYGKSEGDASATQLACNQLCLEDSRCSYATFLPNLYCIKFSEENCKLTDKNNRHITYKRGKAKELAQEINKFFSKKYYWRDWFILVNKYKPSKDEQWFLPMCHVDTYTYVKDWKKTYSIVISSVSKTEPVRIYRHRLYISRLHSAWKYGESLFHYRWQLTCKRRSVVGIVREGYSKMKKGGAGLNGVRYTGYSEALDGPIYDNNTAAIIPPSRSRVLSDSYFDISNMRKWYYRVFIFG